MAQKRNAWQEALASFQRLTQGAGQAVQSFTNNPIGRSVVSTAMNSNPITQNFNMARQMAQPVLPLIRPQVQSFSQKIVPQMRPITQNIMSNPLVKTYTNLAQGYKTNLDNVRNTAGTFLSNNPNFSTSPLGAALSGNWSQSGKSLVNLPNYYNQLEANKVKAWQSGDPQLQKQVVEGDVTAVLNTIGGPTGTIKTKINRQLEPTVQKLRHLLSSREVYLVDEFTDWVRSTGGKSNESMNKIDYNTLKNIQAMTTEAFGSNAQTWSNKKIADAWQYVLKRLSEGRNSIGMGLSVNDISDAFAKKGSSKILGQKIGGEIVDQGTGLKPKGKSFGGIIPQSVDEVINKVKSKVDKIYTMGLDRFHPISKLGKQAGEDQAMRNAITGYYGAGSIGKYHIDFELSPILKSIDPDDLRVYTVAQRDLELAERNIQGSNQGDAQEIINGLKEKYGGDLTQLDTAANKLYEYQKNLVQQYLVDTGIISKEGLEAMTKNNQKYVPFKRIMDQVDEHLGMTPQTRGAGSVASQDVIKGIKGSKRDIVDPLQSIIENTYKIVGLGKRQQVAQTIVGLKDKLPTGTITELRGNVGTAKNVISLFENGKVKKYLVPPEVADAAKGMSEEGLNAIIKILSYPTRLFRSTATGLNPEFAIPNVSRDLQSAFINNGLNPLKFVSGLAHYMKKDQVYQDFLKAGGMTSRIALDEPYLKQTVLDLTGRKKALRLTDPRRIYQILQLIGQASEQPTRIASFESARNAALKKGLPDAAARGAYAAQEGSVNFARRGSQTPGFNAIYAFLNARAQGIDRLIRSAKANPKGVGLRVGMITVAPAIGLYAYNRNFKSYYDPRVVPDYVKQNNFVIMLGDEPISALGGAQYITIPKGDVGKLANPIESFMQYADGKGGDIQSSLLSVLQGFSPISNFGDIIPTALRPVVEDRANYSFFKGRDIVSESKKNYPAPYQTNKNTAAIYNQAGQLLNYSPAKLENLTRGYLTGFARIGEQLTQPFAKKDTYSGEDINQTPIIRRFMGGAQRSEEEQQQNDSYELKNLQKKIQDIRAGIKYGNIPEDAGLREIEKIQGQVETKVKQQSYFGIPEAGASNDITFTSSPDKSDIIPNTLDFTEEDSAPSTVSIADEIKIDNIKAQIKKTGQAQEYQGKVYYPNTNRDKILSIDLTTKLEDPQFTNNPTLDKEILSDYQGKITSKTNEIVKLTTLISSTTNKPYLTPDQAETLITGLKQKLESVKASQKTPTNFELTGDPVIDKSIRSRFQGQITSQINEVVDYVQEGKLTPEQGRDIINRLNARRGSLSGGGSGGGRKKKVNYRGVKITAKPIKIPTLKLKLPKTKIPKYKPIKAIRVRYKS